MDVGGQHGGARSKFDDFREVPLWNIECRHELFTNILAERDAAIEGRNRAWLEKERALAEREMAVSQRNLAIKERDDAVMERNKAFHALHDSMRQTLSAGHQLDVNRVQAGHPYGARELQILDALCRISVASECDEFSPYKTTKDSKGCTWKRKREKPTSESDHLKVNNWDGQNLGLNRVDYDASIMPPPVCSCTGIPRQCYKWGSGGWQSSCCTKTLSVYPLPVVPNKRYARVGGRKMTGSAFSKLLSRLASEGFDYSMPVDLKDHWSKHGTNRYITIK
ncbi:protein BASIC PENTACYSTEINE4-like [Amaranthus tricolor]|uniref:protein BASIC PENTACYSTEINE4-like n=1 Tax=Amaranthus tricolor TaxID=29722 RepID=UPI002585F15E|nr:protein BASIC PENTACYSTEINE4-like [Amaranthus tricolor]XP_057545422.1 protein BASIC PENTACYSTEINE4-like [Amaranthus tricolor]XP_057545430.1 protein BASIC PENTACYSTEINE4-like [Amaranthus tricolor]